VVAVKVEAPLSLVKFRTPPVVFASGLRVAPNSAVPEEPARGPMAAVIAPVCPNFAISPCIQVGTATITIGGVGTLTFIDQMEAFGQALKYQLFFVSTGTSDFADSTTLQA
jgi:hypothetical protein